jgi:glycosyltransferase involved in cell wall biosynthesis
MLCGLPVIATDIRGPREQVVDGQTGLLVPPATVDPLARALRSLAEDAGLRRQFGDAGLARAQARFREDRVLQRTLDTLSV